MTPSLAADSPEVIDSNLFLFILNVDTRRSPQAFQSEPRGGGGDKLNAYLLV